MTEDRQPAPGERPASDDPVAAIEAALGALRRGPRGAGPGGGPGGRFGGPPFGAGPGGPLGGPPFGEPPFGGGPGRRAGRRDDGATGRERPEFDDRFDRGDPHERLREHLRHHQHGDPRSGPAALRLLAALARSGPCSVGDLAEAVGVDQPRASRLVRAAVDAGHVRREVDPADARRSILVITDAGRATLASTLGRRRQAIQEALAGFDDAERAEFARLLQKFVAAWAS